MKPPQEISAYVEERPPMPNPFADIATRIYSFPARTRLSFRQFTFNLNS